MAFALGSPGFGPRRIAAELRREQWQGIVISPNGVWRILRRHGIFTRLKRLAIEICLILLASVLLRQS